MKLIRQYLTNNDCYRAGRYIKPTGIMVHSTGVNQTRTQVYLSTWNMPGVDKCVHAFIGILPDGSFGTVQTLPWDMRGWHAGGDANNTCISFEICEDALESAEYFEKAYREAVELTAMLCREFGLTEKDVLCHCEGYARGVASNHAVVMHWFPRFGKSMDDFRNDVKEELEVSYEKFVDYMERYIAELSDKEPSEWSAKAREWAEAEGIIRGNEYGEKMYRKPMTREEYVQMEYRQAHK